MPSKNSRSSLIRRKQASRSSTRSSHYSKPSGFRSINYKTAKPIPDTSRIPWFPPVPKTGTDA